MRNSKNEKVQLKQAINVIKYKGTAAAFLAPFTTDEAKQILKEYDQKHKTNHFKQIQKEN